jgi:aryl-alcohol dehydrogenase-like predicted oxidoreductase
MRYRLFGKTGIRISEIGFGAWGIGGTMWLGAVDSESMTALRKAVDAGINFFDTALVYGDGHSEVLIGKLLRDSSEQLYVSSKVPPKNMQWPARPGVPSHEAFTKEYIIDCTNTSLKNLRLERLDLQQLHVWRDDWVAVDEIWEAAETLKRAGKIRAFGISINDHEPASALAAARTGLVDSFQVIYNIFDQSPEDELLPYCHEHSIGVIARVPFDEGGLTGRITLETVFPDKDWRNDYFRGERKQQVFERAEKLKQLLGAEARTLPELALRYILSHPAITTAIPGMRTDAHVESNAEVSDGRLLSDSLQKELKKHRWVRNFYKS